MSLVVQGKLRSDWLEAETEAGEFVRHDSQFRNWITPQGDAGPSGEAGFAAEPGRYHLYISYACPWAHRTLIFRKLKNLESLIGVSVVNPYMGPEGWSFADYPGTTKDDVNGADYMYQNYLKAQADYTGIVTVPVLWDKQRQTIVNNESSEIIRMFNSAFAGHAAPSPDYYPLALRGEIDEINDYVYDNVNNGVYRVGFATTQQAYNEAFDRLFGALDFLEHRLSKQRYLVGQQITEADWRLFPTLVRFDAVYVGHFKCNARRIYDYPNLHNYLLELYQQPGIAETVNMDHIKQHYYTSHPEINPTGIVPKGPLLDFNRTHNREHLS